MTFASYIKRERIVRMRKLLREIFCLPFDELAGYTGREKLFTNYNAF